MVKGNKDCEQSKTLNRRFEDHLEEYRSFTAETRAIHSSLERLQLRNTEAIAHLTESTQGVVNAWTFANNLHKFIKWLVAFAASVFALMAWLHDMFPSLG